MVLIDKDLKTGTLLNIGQLFLHEAGHSFAVLADEYLLIRDPQFAPSDQARQGLINLSTQFAKDAIHNCAINPNIEYSLLGSIYGGTKYNGCTIYNRFRPSNDSLMQGGYAKDYRFNVVSCGYIIKAIKKVGHAWSYFPECAAMAAKDGSIIPVGQ